MRVIGLILGLGAALSASAEPQTGAELYGGANVWSVRLKVEPEQLKAMEPKGGGGPFGGMRMPGPAMVLAPAFMNGADANSDQKVSREELAAMGEKWFAAWDTNKTGKVDADKLRAGLNQALTGPGGGPPQGPRMMLQGPEGKRNGVASAMGIELEYVRGDLEFEGKAFTNVAVRYKGNGTFLQSRMSDKKPLKVDLNEFVKAHRLAGVSKINLHNTVTDPGYMNETLAYRLYREAGAPAPRTAFARVTLNDKKLGLYCLVENVDKNFTQEVFKTKGGEIFKPVTPSLFSFLGDDWARYKQTYDPKDEPSKEAIARVIDTCRFVTSADDAKFAEHIGDFIDLENFARYLAVTVWLTDLDGILGPGQNYYLFLHPQTKKFHFIAWDQDHSFGTMRGSQEEREELSIQQPWIQENRFLERMFKVEAFKKLYLARMEEFSKSLFAPERFHAQVDALAPVIRPAIKEESDQKLRSFDQAVRGETPSGGGFGFGPPGMGGAKPIKPFVTARTASVRAQLAGKSDGRIIEGGGFGPPRRGPGRPGGVNFGPGNFLSGVFMSAMDADKDASLTGAEVTDGFAKWFAAWDTDKSADLSDEELRGGIDKDLTPFRGGPPPRP